MNSHYVPNVEEIKRAREAGMTDRQIIKLCKDDPDGKWLKANQQSMRNKGWL